MKKTLVVLFKVLLPLFFLYNIGFFSLNFSGLFKNASESAPFNQKNNSELIKFVNEKTRKAEQKDRKYGPYDYFRDLREIKQFEKEHPGTMGYHNMINQLMSLHSNNIKNRYFTGEDVSKARNYFEELDNPGITLRNKIENERFQKTWWPNFSAWLLKVYLKNIPLAFFLFLFWWYQEKKNLKVSNPLSFFISLIFYPITIGLVIKEALTEESRYYFAEAELRRTKSKMFSILSSDEVADLRRFARSRGLTLSDWKGYLSNQGFTPQHLIIPAITVTILFMFIPRVSFSQEVAPLTSAKVFTENVLIVNIDAPPDIKYSDNTNYQKTQFNFDYPLFNTLFSELNLKNINPVFIRAWLKKIKAQEVILKIEHVPCLSF